MRLILKRVGMPPEFINTISEKQIEAVREVLGFYVTPAFFNQSVRHLFCFAHDSQWQINGGALNFFGTILRIPGYPVTPIYGDAVFMRKKPVPADTRSFSGYLLDDCTEDDMQFLRRHFLSTGTQLELCSRFESSLQEMWSDHSMATSRTVEIKEDIAEWKRRHPSAPASRVLGEGTQPIPDVPAVHSAKGMKYHELDQRKFTHYCNCMGIQCSFHANMVLLRTKVALWRIFREGIYVRQLSHENYLTDNAKSLGFTVPKEGFHLHENKSKNLYHVVAHIAEHDEERWRSKIRLEK